MPHQFPTPPAGSRFGPGDGRLAAHSLTYPCLASRTVQSGAAAPGPRGAHHPPVSLQHLAAPDRPQQQQQQGHRPPASQAQGGSGPHTGAHASPGSAAQPALTPPGMPALPVPSRPSQSGRQYAGVASLPPALPGSMASLQRQAQQGIASPGRQGRQGHPLGAQGSGRGDSQLAATPSGMPALPGSPDWSPRQAQPSPGSARRPAQQVLARLV